MTNSLSNLGTAIFGAMLLILPNPGLADTEPWLLETWQTPYDYQSPSTTVHYTPLEKARKKWRICTSYPHLRNAYWLSVNYGMVQEARRLGVSLEVVEAGGYPNMKRQISQITECAKRADILVLATVSLDGLTETVRRIAKRIPVVAVVNDISDEGISAKVGVSWVAMGRIAGEFLARQHPVGTPRINVAWFPGPLGAGWVPFVERGFRGAVSESSARIAVTKYGHTGKENQILLIEEALEEYPDIDYIVGSGVTADAAVGVLRARGLTDQIKVLSDYLTHAVYRGLKRGRIVAAPTDFPVIQGRLGIEQAVRVLENKLEIKHVGPTIKLLDTASVNDIGTNGSLAPATFAPTFIVE
jgi:protein TorT